MANFSSYLGSGWSADGITDVFNSRLPGDYMRAGKAYNPGGTWAINRGYASKFKQDPIDMFSQFMSMQNNPEKLIEDEIKKGSPDFVLTNMRFK